MYKRGKNSWIKHLDFIIADIIMMEVAFLVSYMFRMNSSNPFEARIYNQMGVVLILIDLIVVVFNHSYKGILRRGFFIEFQKTFVHVSLVILLTFTYMFFVQASARFSRIVFFMTWGSAFVLLYAERIFLKAFIRRRMVYYMDKRAFILVTTVDEVRETLRNFQNVYYRDYSIQGIVLIDDVNHHIEHVDDVPVIGDAVSSLEYISRNVVDELFIHINKKYELPDAFIEACEDMGITTHLVMMQADKMRGEQMIEQFADYTVLTSSFRMADSVQLLYKRMMDIAGGVVGILLTGILFIFVAPIIKIQSPGPIFFGQNRVGLNGRIFKIYKFRSMYMDAEERKKELMAQNEMDGFMFKMKDDPRIFPFGNFIRKTSIDEFPQFWNVLKGDMSLVGTRPPTVDEYNQYSPHHKKRLMMKPGITGLWQVSGRSAITDFEDVVKLDTKYISNWNIGQDIKIIGQTVVTVLKRKGSS